MQGQISGKGHLQGSINQKGNLYGETSATGNLQGSVNPKGNLQGVLNAIGDLQGNINPTGNLQGAMSTESLIGGQVVGMRGFKGDTGQTGETGNGIASAVLNPDYTLTLTFTDGTTYTTSSIRGEQGQKGDTGQTGQQGERGVQGETGETGNGIASVTKTASVGKLDTYTILFTDGTTTTFNVKNGEDGMGAGDMLKADYDSNEDGKVNASDVADSVAWSGVTGKPESYPPSLHTHDDRYYTETEADNKFALISDISDMATKAWVNAQGFITSLAGYATEAWVEAKGYLTSVLWSDISDRPDSLSDFTDDLGSSPTHTHSQYVTKQDAELTLNNCTITDSGSALSVTSGAGTEDGQLAQAVIDAFDYATAKEILEV